MIALDKLLEDKDFAKSFNRLSKKDRADFVDMWPKLSDKSWRMNNLYYVTNKEGEVVLFKQNDDQKDFFQKRWYKNIILKARQKGFSTEIQLEILDDCLFIPNIRAGVIAQDREAAEEIFESKLKFAFEHLPEMLRELLRGESDSASKMTFANNSSVRVGTSLRSGTYQRVHVSEYGKISAENPSKAREVITGTLNAVPKSGMIYIESTAEGLGNYFHKMVVKAQKVRDKGKKLSNMEYKFHFYPWWSQEEYRDDAREIPLEDEKYFDELQYTYGIYLDDEQKSWYVNKKAEQNFENGIVSSNDMFREYPSHEGEPFWADVIGSYYGSQILNLRKQEQICRIPFDPRHPVHVAFDLGRNDFTAMWFFQDGRKSYYFNYYYENSGEPIEHYARIIKDLSAEHNFVVETIYLPHDGSNQNIVSNDTPQSKMWDLGFQNVIVVTRTPNLQNSIQTVRSIFPRCWFDEKYCEIGLTHLGNYRKKYDRKNETFLQTPEHDDSSHGSDAFRTAVEGHILPNDYEDFEQQERQHKRRSNSVIR